MAGMEGVNLIFTQIACHSNIVAKKLLSGYQWSIVKKRQVTMGLKPMTTPARISQNSIVSLWKACGRSSLLQECSLSYIRVSVGSLETPFCKGAFFRNFVMRRIRMLIKILKKELHPRPLSYQFFYLFSSTGTNWKILFERYNRFPQLLIFFA